MITIHKYVASIHDYEKPKKTCKIMQILNVGRHESSPPEIVFVWAMVDDAKHQETTFNIIGTGHEVPPNNRFCGTVIVDPGLVWHLFVPENNFPNPSFGRKVVE